IDRTATRCLLRLHVFASRKRSRRSSIRQSSPHLKRSLRPRMRTIGLLVPGSSSGLTSSLAIAPSRSFRFWPSLPSSNTSRSLGSGASSRFFEDVLHVHLHRRLGDKEGVGDGLIRKALLHQVQYFVL